MKQRKTQKKITAEYRGAIFIAHWISSWPAGQVLLRLLPASRNVFCYFVFLDDFICCFEGKYFNFDLSVMYSHNTAQHVLCMYLFNRRVNLEMQNQELQDEEREVLMSIYDGDPAFKQLSSNTYQYKVIKTLIYKLPLHSGM